MEYGYEFNGFGVNEKPSFKEVGEAQKSLSIVKRKLKFGDVIENFWASNDNPRKKGVFLKFQLVHGVDTMYVTDMKGNFWNMSFGVNSNFRVSGSIVDQKVLL